MTYSYPRKILFRLKEGFPEYEFNFQVQGNGWCRAFILHDKISLGRINFKPILNSHEIYGIKHYKPNDYEYEIRDDIFYVGMVYLITNKRIPIQHLVQIAKQRKKKINKEKLEWREKNPMPIKRYDENGNPIRRRRRKLETNWMSEFRKLVQQEIEKILKEKKES
jgi:hypothetical protein